MSAGNLVLETHQQEEEIKCTSIFACGMGAYKCMVLEYTYTGECYLGIFIHNVRKLSLAD